MALTWNPRRHGNLSDDVRSSPFYSSSSSLSSRSFLTLIAPPSYSHPHVPPISPPRLALPPHPPPPLPLLLRFPPPRFPSPLFSSRLIRLFGRGAPRCAVPLPPPLPGLVEGGGKDQPRVNLVAPSRGMGGQAAGRRFHLRRPRRARLRMAEKGFGKNGPRRPAAGRVNYD